LKKIVVIESASINPGDLSWEPLKTLGPCKFYERTPPEKLIERCKDFEIVLTNKSVYTSDVLAQLTKLKYLGVMATGYNVIDIAAAKACGIVVTNVPDYGAPSVSQMVFAHVLNLTQRLRDHHDAVLQGRWREVGEFCFWDYPLVELAGLNFGVLGFGNIGKRSALIARGFGMNVLLHTPHPPKGLPENYQIVDLPTLFRKSDVLSLHCPLTQKTEKIVNAERLNLMKQTAFLINTSRGGLIDEIALCEALLDQKIAGAGLDVLSQEPPPKDHPLFNLPNCYISPHNAWATAAARQRLLDKVVENLRRFLFGNPINLVT
jgi:glycerate dehydrogenase